MLPSGFRLWTAEQPWAGNAVGRSCIPDGTYRCRPRRYFAGGYDAIEVVDVPGRTNILFHRGNKPSDVRGCIVPGVKTGALAGEWAVLGSAEAFAALMVELGGREWSLTISSGLRATLSGQ